MINNQNKIIINIKGNLLRIEMLKHFELSSDKLLFFREYI